MSTTITARAQTDALADAPYGTYRNWLFQLPVLVRGHRGKLIGQKLVLPVPENAKGEIVVVPERVYAPYSNDRETWWICRIETSARLYRGKPVQWRTRYIKVLESELRRSRVVLPTASLVRS